MLIACATDRRFVHLAGVLLASILAKGEVPEADLVVLGWDLTRRDKARLKACCGSQAARLRFLDLDREAAAQLQRLHIKWATQTRATYLRLLLPDLLPQATGRLLYLDSDTLVNGSLRPLFEMPLRGHAVAAVPTSESARLRCNRALGLPPEQPYMNSGVLLIDLEAWRAQDLTRRMLDFALANAARGNHHDQDAINAVLAGGWLPLDRAWNFFDSASEGAVSPREAYLAARIIHFIGPRKPTAADCPHPARDLFLARRRATPWRYRPLVTPLERRLRKSLAKRLQWLKRLGPTRLGEPQAVRRTPPDARKGAQTR